MSEEATPQDAGSQEVATEAPQETAAPNFLEQIPEDLRAEPSLANFQDVGSLAKSYVHAQRMIGADKVAIPSGSATEDEWRAVFQKLGAPEDPAGYEIEADDAFKEAAFKAGMTPRQAETALEFMRSQQTAAEESRTAQAETLVQEAAQELQAEWGKAFEQKVQMAHNAASQLLGNTEIFETVELADGRKLGDHPEVVRMFAKLADELGEDRFEGAPSELVMTPEQAKAEIAKLQAPNGPYWDKMHPEHDVYVNKVHELFQYATPA